METARFDGASASLLPFGNLQYRCAGLSSCQSLACRVVQAHEPAAGIIVIDIPAVLDCADAVKNLSGLIELFGCARSTSAICGSVNLILVVGFIDDHLGVIPRHMFQEILRLIAELRLRPPSAPA